MKKFVLIGATLLMYSSSLMATPPTPNTPTDGTWNSFCKTAQAMIAYMFR